MLWFFDLDGTLADTDADIRASWKAAMADLGLVCETFDRDFIAGPPIDEMARRLFGDIFTPDLAVRLRERFGFHYDSDGCPRTNEYPGVIAACRRLKAMGDRLYIATNKRWEGAMALWNKFGWGEVFSALYTADMHRNDEIGKLSKASLLDLAMREAGVKSDDCVMVGDTINDFTAANANSMRSIAVTWGYGTQDEFAHASLKADSAEDLLALRQRL